ncbi:MAG: YDG domain-containing protein, partial [Clostridia bacterium]
MTGSGVITRGAGVGGSLLTITGGSLTLGGNVTLSGANAVGARSALVRVRGGELILLPGATLRGNAGDGVCVEGGRFQMAGGRISENNGSGVSVTAGTFEMKGGSIEKNGGAKCNYGGGVKIAGGAFTMSGGTICENHARGFGGGVYLTRGAFEMRGGTMARNHADRCGGGAYLGGGSFKVRGGAQVTGNTVAASKTPGNLYLHLGTIAVVGALDGAQLGVTVARPGVETPITGEFDAGWATNARFASDNPAYAVACRQGAGGKVWLCLQPGKPEPPTITTQPSAPKDATYGSVFGTLKVAAKRADVNGGDQLVYAWHKSARGEVGDGDEKVGADAVYELPPGLPAGTHFYYCRVTASRKGAPSSGPINSTVAAVRVLPRSIADATLEVASAIYMSGPILPQITVTDGFIALVEGVDYAVKYENNTNAARAASEKAPTVTISGLGNYDPATWKSQKFTIDQAPIRVIGGTICEKTYDGGTDAQVSELFFDGLRAEERLTIGIDYAAGTPAFDSAFAGQNGKTVTGTAELLPSVKARNYDLIGAYRLTDARIAPRLAVLRWSGIATRTYDGKAASVGATVENLVPGECCEVFVTGGDAKNAGTHTAKARLDNGNYALSENSAQRYAIEKAVLTPRIGTKDGPVARAYRPDDRAFEGAAIELSGAVAGEHPTATARIEFVDADAGSDKPANARDIRLGDWAANYALSSDAIAGQRVPGACVFAASQAAPGAPTCLSRTATRVALSALAGASYRCGGAGAQDAWGAWQDVPT